jgi:hypothetical protein
LDAVTAQIYPRNALCRAAVFGRPLRLEFPTLQGTQPSLPAPSINCRNASLLMDQCATRARFVAVFSKLAESWFNRQAISRTPSLMVASASSNQRSAGVSLPSC